jgi:uncharacterized protein (DUF1697 family)
MTRYAAFLRAINVGGRVVTMDALRRLLEAEGMCRVQTIVASGNVVFETAASDAARLERRLEQALEQALGYRVATFVRTPAELSAVVKRQPFTEAALRGTTLYVGFLKQKPGAAERRALLALASELNAFELAGRELYWLSRGPFAGRGMRRFDGATLEKTLGMAATLRNVSTVRKTEAKCYDSP